MSAPHEYIELGQGNEWWHPPSSVYAEVLGLRLGREGLAGFDQTLAVATSFENPSERLLFLHSLRELPLTKCLDMMRGVLFPTH